jgi:arginyl-tRNA--protein-N-Asp/Glu arginylyltransferase
MSSTSIRVGLTPEHPCSYLSDQQEQLVVVLDDWLRAPHGYEQLLQSGFRRSGNDLYRPQCTLCQACQSLRINPQLFRPSRHQKRVLRENRDLDWRISRGNKPEYYQLYDRYIRERHSDGSMYPPSVEQYEQFLFVDWLTPYFLECYDQNKLIAVAITDVLTDSVSAMYTFFDPDYHRRSLGTLAVLTQLRLTQQLHCSYLYLGYQIDQCTKMNYKSAFLPHERLDSKVWKKYGFPTD